MGRDFVDSTVYRNLTKRLADILATYWSAKEEQDKEEEEQARRMNASSAAGTSRPRPKRKLDPDVLWVQCDFPQCLKWRTMPKGFKASDLPESWFCHMHPDPRFQSHSTPEENWDNETSAIYANT